MSEANEAIHKNIKLQNNSNDSIESSIKIAESFYDSTKSSDSIKWRQNGFASVNELLPQHTPQHFFKMLRNDTVGTLSINLLDCHDSAMQNLAMTIKGKILHKIPQNLAMTS